MASVLPDHTLDAVHDETRAADGSVLPGWRRVLSRLSTYSPEQITHSQQEINRQLRANGVAYSAITQQRVESRPWQLDLIPQVLEADDWQTLSRGLLQRARLKQALLHDLYGEQQVLTHGVVPPSLVYAHKGFLRSAQHLPGMHRLPLIGVDVSRSPSGDWYVVDDICQAPDGIGYTLENRLVLSRVLPDLFRESRVQRVVGYFRALQRTLTEVIDRDARCVMLGYGASNAHYFEYAYLAKYLGYTLVEINDLTVRGERVWLKTVAGLQRVDVILRFIDDQDMDPLAVSNGAEIGVPGLLQAAHAGNVHIINPLGTAVLDNPAFNAYLPELCRFLLNEEVTLRSAPTYWLGDPTQLAHVRSRFDDLLFRHIDTIGQLLDPGLMAGSDRLAFEQAIELVPHHYVAQERVDRSVAPSLAGSQSVMRQTTIRTFLTNTNDGFEIMQGGLCLLDTVSGGRRPPRDALEGSKDVWVLSDDPVVPDSLLPSAADTSQYAMLEGELPSRVGDNLFWFGRKTESAENIIRVMRGVCRELQNDDSPVETGKPQVALFALLKAATTVTGTTPGFVGSGGTRRCLKPNRELQSLLHDEQRVGGLAHTLQQIQRTAGSVRDRVSPELLRILNELNDQQEQLHALPASRDFSNDPQALNATIERLNGLLTSLAAMAGLAHENFTRGDGWRFMMLGKRVERARQSTAIIGSVMQHTRDDNRLLEDLLRVFDSVMTYRSRYRSQIETRLVLHLLLLDESNPRSVAYQFQRIDEIIRQLPGMRRADNQDPLLKLATAGLSRVRLADAAELLDSSRDSRQSLKKFLHVLEELPGKLGTALTAAYFTHTEVKHSLESATVQIISADEEDNT